MNKTADMKAYKKAWRAAHPENMARDYARRRQKRADRNDEEILRDHDIRSEYYKKHRAKYIANAKKYQTEHRAENKPYIKILSLVQTALRNGTLVKSPCEMCGNEKVQAHHCDYSKPLEVMWLCKRCHCLWHAKNKPLNQLNKEH